ncbi:MAG: ROK family protein [Bacteroidetes bacterium]|jgi:glucokinase|nr:ROK family protein [Bacteroidota bacterium]
MDYLNDDRIVLLLDAGGTNFVYSAKQFGRDIVPPLTKPAYGNDLDVCIKKMIEGFQEIISQLPKKPAAISFAFPGPADYPKGIIGDLKNLSGFRGGVPLGSILQNAFHIPVFINNDGDLFAYGEALTGILPEINKELTEKNNALQFKNLVGLTLGTGFGGGMVLNQELYQGDNAMGMEVWLMGNRFDVNAFAENKISTAAIINTYSQYSSDKNLMPKDIYEIAMQQKPGDAKMAQRAFEIFGQNLGEVIANLITLFDGVIVLGGGIAAAGNLFMPGVMDILNSYFEIENEKYSRIVQQAFYYNDKQQKSKFLESTSVAISVPGKEEKLLYNPRPKIPIAISKQGAGESILLGAYTYALKQLG